jgi:hypothetical protein
MNYFSEKELVNEFISCLSYQAFSTFGLLDYSTEFNYQRGKTDIIAKTEKNDIIAFEAKLNKWREALYQAYRNTCFSHYSYVLLPASVVKNALVFSSEFELRSIGICWVDNSIIHIAQDAKRNYPLQQWLSSRAINVIDSGEIYGKTVYIN